MTRRYLRTIEERLQEYSILEPSTGCRLWTAGKDGVGYGEIWDGSRNRGAHVVAWEQANGRPVRKGYCVCHRCDVHLCIEPTHLFEGTKADNNADMDRKGRSRRPSVPGMRNGRAKLSDDNVRAIRADMRNPKVIAPEYGVHWSVIYQVKQRRRWGHVN